MSLRLLRPGQLIQHKATRRPARPAIESRADARLHGGEGPPAPDPHAAALPHSAENDLIDADDRNAVSARRFIPTRKNPWFPLLRHRVWTADGLGSTPLIDVGSRPAAHKKRWSCGKAMGRQRLRSEVAYAHVARRQRTSGRTRRRFVRPARAGRSAVGSADNVRRAAAGAGFDENDRHPRPRPRLRPPCTHTGLPQHGLPAFKVNPSTPARRGGHDPAALLMLNSTLVQAFTSGRARRSGRPARQGQTTSNRGGACTSGAGRKPTTRAGDCRATSRGPTEGGR